MELVEDELNERLIKCRMQLMKDEINGWLIEDEINRRWNK